MTMKPPPKVAKPAAPKIAPPTVKAPTPAKPSQLVLAGFTAMVAVGPLPYIDHNFNAAYPAVADHEVTVYESGGNWYARTPYGDQRVLPSLVPALRARAIAKT